MICITMYQIRNALVLIRLPSVEVRCPTCKTRLRLWSLATKREYFTCSLTGLVW